MGTRKCKYNPKLGDEIKFYHKKEEETGIVTWIGHNALSVYPHTVYILDLNKEPLKLDWFVENSDVIGEVNGV